MKILMAAIMQNGLMVQQLQLMVALRQKKIDEEENRKQRKKDEKEEEKKQTKLEEEEVRAMSAWSEKESQRYVEKYRGYKGDRRCKKCSWFGHRAHQCRREEVEAAKELRGGSDENRWKPLECRVMKCNEEREAARSVRKEAQQGVKCWGCGEIGHCLWTCPTKAARPLKGEAQQERRVTCRACKGENHITRNCENYWRWREWDLREKVKRLRKQKIEELTKKVKELKEIKEKAKGEERVVRCTM